MACKLQMYVFRGFVRRPTIHAIDLFAVNDWRVERGWKILMKEEVRFPQNWAAICDVAI